MNVDPPAPLPIEPAAPWKPAASWKPAGLALYFGGAAFAAQFARDHHLPWPGCWFRELTGVPCPTCGCTRCLLALTHFDFAAALRLNPLFTAGCLVLTLWLAGTLADRFLGTRAMEAWFRFQRRWPVGRFAIALVALNWLYLCLTLPR